MKYRKTISLLVLAIIVLALFASLFGIFSAQGPGQSTFKSIQGQTVSIYGKGLYKNDSVTIVAQGIAQDMVTMLLGIPLLLVSLYLSWRGSLKGRLLLTGTLGYFLYTYISYTFLWMYNPLFLVYVALMSGSSFAFTLSMLSFDLTKLGRAFNPKFPVKFIGGFQIFFAVALAILWLSMIVPTITNNKIPAPLEHYTTLVIQAMDLGFIVPLALISGILLLKRESLGYLLSSVIIIKFLTLSTALTAMIISQAQAGVLMSSGTMLAFPMFNLLIFYSLVVLLKNIKESGDVL